MNRLRIAIVEDDPVVQASYRSITNPTHDTTFYRDCLQFLELKPRAKFDLILLDLSHAADPEGVKSIAGIGEIKSLYPNAELIIQSGIQDIEAMRRCVNHGANKFLSKDNMAEYLPALLEVVLQMKTKREEMDQYLIGNSSAMLHLKRELLEMSFSSNQDILIEGETGSGKELCAKALHTATGPLVSINCSAIPPELFEAEFFGSEKGAYTGSAQTRQGHLESANDGTLFLDEIQSLPLNQQAKLLRVLETRTYTRVGSSTERSLKCRLVFASNLNLKDLVQKNLFREDFYYRIASLQVQVPPLRIRKADIPELTLHFVESLDPIKKKQFSQGALQSLSQMDYDWPGNVRELRNVVRTLCLKSKIPVIDDHSVKTHFGTIDLQEDSPVSIISSSSASSNSDFQIRWDASFDANIAALEQHLLQKTIEKYGTAKAREHLGIARTRFYEKLKQYQLAKVKE